MRSVPTITVNKRAGERGHAMVELALLCPWILLLFMGIFDFGFYIYAALLTQNAANVAALYTSADWSRQTDQETACAYILREMTKLPNMTGVTACNVLPVIATVTTSPLPCVAAAIPPSPCQTVVSVTYRTDQRPMSCFGRIRFRRQIIRW
jgi:Flp pilus assembly protein TadG